MPGTGSDNRYSYIRWLWHFTPFQLRWPLELQPQPINNSCCRCALNWTQDTHRFLQRQHSFDGTDSETITVTIDGSKLSS